MIGLIQRVKSASVRIDNNIYSEINNGILLFLGIEKFDKKQQADKLADKISKLRIFEDENGKMNKSILDINGEMLVVSQFTLAGNCAKGTRPSFDKAENPDLAKELYEYFITEIKSKDIPTQTGMFGAMMDVSLVNDGPVTFILKF